MITYRLLSSSIIIATFLVLGWHLLKNYMAGDVGLQLDYFEVGESSILGPETYMRLWKI